VTMLVRLEADDDDLPALTWPREASRLRAGPCAALCLIRMARGSDDLNGSGS
jgi:hypothetical protein